MRDKVTRQSPQTTTFEEKGEPKRIRTEVPPLTQPNALPLGQTGLLMKGMQSHYSYSVQESQLSVNIVSAFKDRTQFRILFYDIIPLRLLFRLLIFGLFFILFLSTICLMFWTFIWPQITSGA